MNAEPGAQTAALQAEHVERPEPGLARGVWEAPRWAFVAVLVLVALAVVLGGARVLASRARRGGER